MNNTISTHFFPVSGKSSCPFLGFNLSVDRECLVRVDFVLSIEQRWQNVDEPTEVMQLAGEQIFAYLTCELREFSLPIFLHGTEFQRDVWREILNIPFGKVRSYGQIAKNLGDLNLSRAVGQAANKNPIPLVIPCHRVVGSSGKLTGFASGLPAKSFLLAHEMGGLLW
ncbi:methylated-DNA--[protein]-cysteine S-methyltransferase [Desulfosediminicola flagellatus]|uniref:methylated-DNA--[protein]-cysteine S-methyltransferase n=1 Tax=Desulfosediminicola flagellatus TaxID=2569541 RepID=UPI0010AC885D|nr:methylated-DNA--[protein]-cysteine S-methyltransferase [Desulfosediminicola flagellatus]